MPLKEILTNPIALANGGQLPGAHHPHCDRHDHHLLWIQGRPLCLGCVCLYSGLVVGTPIAFVVVEWSSWNLAMWVLSHWLLLVPTVLQVKLQYKPFKIFSRLMLGMATATYFVSGLFFLTPSIINVWVFRLLVIIVFGVFYYGLNAWRAALTKSPCDDCPLGVFPVCEWNMENLLHADQHQDLLAALQSDDTDIIHIK